MPRRVICQIVLLLTVSILSSIFQPFKHLSALAQPSCQTFRETGKSVCGRFLQYWQQNGGLAQQGLPLSSEFVEVSDLNGQSYTVQYFERAVFEKHPENQPPFDVLLSQLGTFQMQRKYPNGEPSGGGQPPVATQPPAPTGQQVNGRGTQVSNPLSLKKGLAVFHSVHSGGNRNFIVELVDSAGKTVEYLANEIGSANLSSAGRIPADGQYLLKVQADGDWTINVNQPRATYTTPPPSQQWSGKGSQVTGLFSLKAGAARFQATHTNGERNFIVELVNSEGQTV